MRRNRLTEAAGRCREGGALLLDLTLSNPTQAGFRLPEGRILQALARAENLVYRPSPLGHEEARRAVSGYYEQRGVRIPPSRIVLTSSTSEAYSFLFTLLCAPCDSVLIPQPSYPLFDFLASLDGLRHESYSLFYDGLWEYDLDELEERISPASKAVLAVNPNNPTGSFLSPSTAARLLPLCARRGLALICDEVFFDYPLESAPRFDPATSQGTLTFLLNGLSKTAGLPQLKLAWIAVCGPQRKVREAIERLEVIADTFLSVNTPVQVALAELLEAGIEIRRQIHQRVRGNLAFLRSRQQGASFEVYTTEGGWYAVVRLPRVSSEEEWAVGLLEEKSVLAHPGFFYGFSDEPILVLSLLPRAQDFEDAVARLADFVTQR